MSEYIFKVFPGKERFVALAKKRPFLFDTLQDCIMQETGYLYFEFGKTEAEAMEKLKAGLPKVTP